MNQPSDEAMAAAEKLVSVIQDDDDIGLWQLYVCGVNAESYLSRDQNVAQKDARDVRAQIAMAFDLHTAALRAEVEALRARVPVWKSVAEESPPVVSSLCDPKTEDWVLSGVLGLQQVHCAYVRQYENGKRKWVLSGNRVGSEVEDYHYWAVPPKPTK